MKIAIIGAGTLGLGVASRLTERPGVEVVVLDARHPAGGSSGLSAGVFTRLYNHEFDIALRVRAIELLEDLERTQGLVLRRIGLVRLARDEKTLAGLESALANQAKAGVEGSRLLTPGELGALVPLDTSGVVGAIHHPFDGYLDGAELCGSMVAKIRSAGGLVRSNAEVGSVQRSDDGRLVLTLAADGSTVEADVVVNAAGPWAEQVGDMLGAPVPMMNERHEAYLFQLPRSYAGPPLPMVMDYVVGAEHPGVYFRHEGADQLVAGMHSNDILGSIEPDPSAAQTGFTQSGAEQVMAALAELMPSLDLGLVGGWSGLYPHARTEQFVIGAHPMAPGVFVAAGGGGIGVNTGPVLGEIVADQIVDGRSTRFVVPAEWVPGR
ncbi:NAD(P)/FAD-dependent oxidoreductase [Marmoricola sp. RAF53]|uniref:NAD(P)/FAD-dependent oxidoreductase n=1 Tax=Marmoricola sp. RAF53 TaxID=3233059 RepID=UPI003F9A01A3